MRIHDLVGRLEHNAALDRLAEPLQEKVGGLLGGNRALKDALSGTWLGHPLHPALIILPLGSWMSASVLDLVGGRRADPAVQRLLATGIVAAVPTAASGASDWSDTSGAERRVGVVHALGNTAVLGMMAASWWARRRGRRGLGVGLSLAANTIGAGTAYLGGHLTYGQGVGVDTTAFEQGPEDWADAAALDELVDGEPSGADLHGFRVLLVRDGSQVHALAARCTHRGGPLDDGELQEGCITCPWHGSTFDVRTGDVVSGPASLPQPALDTRVVDGRVQVRHRTERGLQAGAV